MAIASDKLPVPTLILGSSSPRRQELLKLAGFNFQIKTVPFTEIHPAGLDANKIAESLALEKSEYIWNTLALDETSLLITADTTVVLQNRVLGKPRNYEEAFDMLSSLSDSSHQVLTGVALHSPTGRNSFTVSTEVVFNLLSEQEIDYYINRFQPFDKAGAYGIQEWIGLTGIREIKGDYYNVMGLPVSRLLPELRKFNCFPHLSF